MLTNDCNCVWNRYIKEGIVRWTPNGTVNEYGIFWSFLLHWLYTVSLLLFSNYPASSNGFPVSHVQVAAWPVAYFQFLSLILLERYTIIHWSITCWLLHLWSCACFYETKTSNVKHLLWSPLAYWLQSICTGWSLPTPLSWNVPPKMAFFHVLFH